MLGYCCMVLPIFSFINTLRTRIFGGVPAQFAILMYVVYIPVASFSRRLAENPIAVSIFILSALLFAVVRVIIEYAPGTVELFNYYNSYQRVGKG